MIIKKFQGKTEVEATDLARAELGQNVVVMNVKTLKNKGLFRLFKPTLVEVTVALEDEPDKIPVKNTVSNPIQNAQIIKDSPKEVIDEKESKAIEEKLEKLHSLIQSNLVRERDSNEKEEEIEETSNETVQFMKLIYNTLIDNEVDEKYANELLDEIGKMNMSGMSIDYMISNIYQKMILKFGQPKVIEPAENGPKVVFFIGPTGVGKTTTIAKIASRFSVNEKKKVVLLTTDTYRIAAAEQLRTYAEILSVPFHIIYSIDEIENAFQSYKEYDYILVDTAGHSHQNEAQKESMNLFVHSLDSKAEVEIYLVVSGTTKYRDLLSITDTYTQMINYKLIFTKLDETTTMGNLLNLRLYTKADLSYVTCGQNVPDDIETFNPQTTVKQLLDGK